MPVRFTRIADDNDTPTEPGTYRRVREYWDAYCASKGRPNTYWAEIVCPGCGRGGLVGSNHTVADDGTVSPSDICAHADKGCTFHEFIVLDDWNRPATPRRGKDGTP